MTPTTLQTHSHFSLKFPYLHLVPASATIGSTGQSLMRLRLRLALLRPFQWSPLMTQAPTPALHYQPPTARLLYRPSPWSRPKTTSPSRQMPRQSKMMTLAARPQPPLDRPAGHPWPP